MVERLVANEKVVGSSPIARSIIKLLEKNYITKLFQKVLENKDLRTFKNKISYYILFRLVRNFLNSEIKIKIYNFYLLLSVKKSSTSHFLLKKCDFSEIREINFIKKISKDYKITFIDGGCNYGFFSFFTASLSDENDVIAIDASEKTCKEFRQNLSINNLQNITLLNKVLSEKSDKQINFYNGLNDWESSAINSGFKNQSVSLINSITIDKILDNKILNKKKLIIKLDLEGYEIQAIYGSIESIRKLKPLIIIELSKYINHNISYNYKSLENFLINENYQIYNLDGKITNMDEIKKLLDSLDEKHQTIGNFYLVNKSSDMLKYI